MFDIPGYKNFTKILPIDKGWSSDKKYYIESKRKEKLLLRISDISQYQMKQTEFKYMQEVSKLAVPMSLPIDIGICDSGKSVYSLFTWMGLSLFVKV